MIIQNEGGVEVELRCFFGGVGEKKKKPRGSHKENLPARRKKLFLKHGFVL